MNLIRWYFRWLDTHPVASQFIITYAVLVAAACTVALVIFVLTDVIPS